MLGRQIATGLILCLTLGAAAQELLWDNGVWEEGNNARAVSPPAFPNIRVADDFVVPAEGWVITRFEVDAVQDANWERPETIEILLYADDNQSPGPLWIRVLSDYEYRKTGERRFGRDEYFYWVDDLFIPLTAGLYWIGFRHPDGAGSGTNYWLESPGGMHGKVSGPHHFSLDGGKTWRPERHQCAFNLRGLRGVPAPLQRFEVTRGVRTGGGMLSLNTSDDVYLIVEARRPTSVSQPSVQIELEAVTEIHDPAKIRFDLEAAVLLKGPIQWIDLYNFDAASWERVDEREATTDDSITIVSIEDDPARFVDSRSGVLRTRVSFYDPGIPAAGWSARIDHVRWLISDR